MNNSEILKYAMNNDIIDMSCIQEMIKMKEYEQLLEQHPYKISQGKDGKWYTYLPSDNGRKKLKRTTEQSIKDAVVNFYKSQRADNKITFDDIYKKWRAYQDNLVSDNTTIRYDTDYIRYFKDTLFSQTELDCITEETLKTFIHDTVQRLSLCKKACKTLFSYIKRSYHSAIINKITVRDPTVGMAAKDFYVYCTKKKRPISKVLVMDNEVDKLIEQFKYDYANQPQYIPTYAVEMAMLTGMRVGELSALRWDAITDQYIIIDKSEKYNRKTKTYFISSTKNEEERIFPLTEQIRDLLDRIKRVEIREGYICEWVFANEKGRVHASIISSCSKNKCRQVGITEKGIHAYRRTINSKMRCEGVSATVASSLLGHTAEVNEQYYTFDVTGIAEKTKIIANINKSVVNK